MSNIIADKNDQIRKTLVLDLAKRSKTPHKLFLSENVHFLAQNNLPAFTALLRKLATHSDFQEENDPWNEHDFGKIELNGKDYFFKFDYYDQSLENWADPKENDTVHVLTLMEASEY